MSVPVQAEPEGLWSVADAIRATRLALAGHSYDQVSAAVPLGAPRTAQAVKGLLYRLRKRGVRIPKRPIGRPKIPLDMGVIESMRAGHASLSVIGAHFGVSHTIIGRRLRDAAQ